MINDDFIPYGEIHQIQINDKELYAFEPVLYDIVYQYQQNIADLRKKLGIPSVYPDTLAMLVQIQEYEGKIIIIENILNQLKSSG